MAPEVLNLYVDGASRGNQHTMEERSTGWGFLAVLGPEAKVAQVRSSQRIPGRSSPIRIRWAIGERTLRATTLRNSRPSSKHCDGRSWKGAIPTSSSAPTQPMRATWQQGHGAPKPTSRSSAD